jgi:hypothetical protein
MIKLNEDETMLLLVTKGWEHKKVPFISAPNSIEYITACCKQRVWGDYATDKNVDVFHTYLTLATKISTVNSMAAILEEIWKHVSGWYFFNKEPRPITVEGVTEYLISALRTRKVTDLILDEALVIRKGE